LFLLGESGIGKTSFLLAGLVPIFDELSLGTVYMENYYSGRQELLLKLSKFISTEEPTITSALNKIAEEGCRIVLLLDQFEKNLYNYIDNSDFLLALEEIVSNNKADIKIVFSLRDDFTSSLWDYSKGRGLNLLKDDNLFTLYRPSVTTIKDIVVKSLDAAEIPYDEITVNLIVEDLLEIHQKNHVYFPDLQIVFAVLSDDYLNQGITLNTAYKSYGGCKNIIEKYFSERIWEDFTPDERAISCKIINELVSLDGIREQNDIATIISKTSIDEVELNQLLTQLVSKRVIKRFVSGDREYYELVHDFMAKKYADGLSDDEKASKSINEMMRHSLIDYKRYGILIDRQKITLIFKNLSKVAMSPDIKKLFYISCFVNFYNIRQIQGLFDGSTDVELLVSILKQQHGDNTSHVYKRVFDTITEFVSIEGIATDLVESASNVTQLSDIARAYYKNGREANLFTRSVINKLCNIITVKVADTPAKDKTLALLMDMLIERGNIDAIFDMFGGLKPYILDVILDYVISSTNSNIANKIYHRLYSQRQQLVIRFYKLLESEATIYWREGLLSFLKINKITLYDEQMIDYLLKRSSKGNVSLKKHMIDALSTISPEKATPALIKLLRDNKTAIRKEAAVKLGLIGDINALIALEEAQRVASSYEVGAIRDAAKALNAKLKVPEAEV